MSHHPSSVHSPLWLSPTGPESNPRNPVIVLYTYLLFSDNLMQLCTTGLLLL